MSKSSTTGGFKPPSGKRIAIETGIALAVAVVVLVTVVWPAEYGRDPTGFGDLVGITNMSTGPTQTIEFVDTIGGNETLREAEIPDFGEPVPLPNPTISQIESEAPVTRQMSVELGENGETEVKALMQEAKVIVYHWEVEDGLVYSDFHGHTPEYGDDFWVRYKEDQRGATSGSGSLVAPFSGEHGWYWVNLSDHPITIDLTVTGYFDDLIDKSDEF